MVIRALKKRFGLLFIYTGILIVFCRVWKPTNLIVPLPLDGFIDFTELIAPLLVLTYISFLLYNNYEIELALTCGVSTPRLVITDYIVSLLYTLIPMYFVIALYQYLPFVPQKGDRIIIPIIIPENYKIYMLISVTVTVLFFSALVLFLRVLMRNCFTPVAIGFGLHITFAGRNHHIHLGDTDIRSALFDPYLSNYFLGDEVPNMYKIDGMHNLWTYNRLLFTGIAVVLLILTYLLLRREKLHESFGE